MKFQPGDTVRARQRFSDFGVGQVYEVRETQTQRVLIKDSGGWSDWVHESESVLARAPFDREKLRAEREAWRPCSSALADAHWAVQTAECAVRARRDADRDAAQGK
jgi:hypothetical protein